MVSKASQHEKDTLLVHYVRGRSLQGCEKGNEGVIECFLFKTCYLNNVLPRYELHMSELYGIALSNRTLSGPPLCCTSPTLHRGGHLSTLYAQGITFPLNRSLSNNCPARGISS